MRVGPRTEGTIEIAPSLLLNRRGLGTRTRALLAAAFVGGAIGGASLLTGGIVVAVGGRGLFGRARGAILGGTALGHDQRRERQQDEMQSQLGSSLEPQPRAPFWPFGVAEGT